ncbi:hypothetical protein Hanom_Chr05g00390781 [Helianthus anomalus]
MDHAIQTVHFVQYKRHIQKSCNGRRRQDLKENHRIHKDRLNDSGWLTCIGGLLSFSVTQIKTD